MDKVHIEKNSVQETLIIPLYTRVQCARLYPEIYQDEESKKAMDRLDYDFTSMQNQKENFTLKFGALETACRQYDIGMEVKAYLKEYPNATVVNLGCGLDPMTKNLDNGTCKMVNLDYPDVIAVRNEILPVGEREKNIGTDINDTSWFDQIDASQGVIFFACGVFYYFKQVDVQKLFCAMNDAFPRGRLVFDSAGKMALKAMIKVIVKESAGIEDVNAYFHAGNPEKDIKPWSNGFTLSKKGYMLGYHDLKVGSVSGMYRLLAHVADGIMKMDIVKIDFQS